MSAPATASAWHARAQELADWALARLFVRTDRCGGYYVDGETTKKTARPKEPTPGAVDRALLARHFRATRANDLVGPFSLAPGASTGRAAFADIDAHTAADDPERNRRYAEHLYGRLADLGFRPLAADYGCGSFHVGALFATDVPGAALHAFGAWLVRDAAAFGLPGPVESFPKQAQVPAGGYGNWLRLIGRHHKRNVWAKVFNGTTWLEGAAAVAHVLSLTGDAPDLIPAEARPAPPTGRTAPGSRPWSARGPHPAAPEDDVFPAYNATVTLEDVASWLEARGHTAIKSRPDRVDFTRADKKPGEESFNVRLINGMPLTYNFSSNAGLPERRALNPVQLRCYLTYGSMDTAAMAKLAAVLRDEMGWTQPGMRWGPAAHAPDPDGAAGVPAGTPGAACAAPIFTDTDIANGRRFVADCGDRVRFVADWSRWIVYDGCRWAVDRSGTLVERLAKETTDGMAADAARCVGAAALALAHAVGEDATDGAKKLKADADRALAHAKRSQDIRAVRRMLESAKSEPAVNVQVGREVFDRHPSLLNCANGTVDLRTGALQPHRSGDFLTRIAPAAYDPAAPRRGYLDFLKKVFRDAPRVLQYVRQLSGYVATGETCDHSFHVFHGSGSNGKSLLLNLWTAALGDGEYEHKSPAELLVNDGRDRHPTEKVGLRGARLVVCQESKEGALLDEAKVKSLTSGDLIDARGMGQDFFTFAPTHKLILSTNHKPRLRGTDEGIRRRIRLVPFATSFWKDADRARTPEGTFEPDLRADPELEGRLTAEERDGVLADMVEHAVAFYAAGAILTPPAEVVAATREYLSDEDIIGQFFDALVRPDPDGRVKGGEFYERFKKWAVAEGHAERKVPSNTKFGTEAKRRFKATKIGVTVYRVVLIDLPV